LLVALCIPVSGAGQQPPGTPAKPVRVVVPKDQAGSKNRVDSLQADPKLQAKLTKNLKTPSLNELLQLLQKETGLKLTVQVDDVSLAKKVFGRLTLHKVPAWQLMHKLEQTLLAEGQWEKVAGGYRLVGKAKYEEPVPPHPQEVLFSWLLAAFPVLLLLFLTLLTLHLRRSWPRLRAVLALRACTLDPPRTG